MNLTKKRLDIIIAALAFYEAEMEVQERDSMLGPQARRDLRTIEETRAWAANKRQQIINRQEKK